MDRKVSASQIERAKAEIVAVVSRYVSDLKKRGSGEYSACCPFHSERTPSFSVSETKQFYKCFGCGASGDAIDFVSKIDGVPFPEAVAMIVGDDLGSASAPPRHVVRKQEDPEWIPQPVVPDGLKARPMDTFFRREGDKFQRLTVSRRWEYKNADGQLIGYVCRFDLPSGGKDVIPQCVCLNKNTGDLSWRWISFGKPRPLYGLDLLAAHPHAQVLVTEGEKACDAARDRYEAAGVSRDRLVVVSWPGGGKAVKHTDWSPLAGRNCALWPDADQKPYPDNHPQAGELMPVLEQPGTVCMLDVADRLDGIAASVKIIVPPAGVPDGWDLADDLPKGFLLLAHSRSNAMPVADFVARFRAPDEPVADPEPEQQPDPEPVPPAGTDPVAPPPRAPRSEYDDSSLLANGYFTILGYDGSRYYFFQHEKKQVLEMTKGDFGGFGLQELAPNHWWEMEFPGEKGMNKSAAVDWLFRACNARGIYDPSRVRGRGAWRDKGRYVFHHGGWLTVDGVKTALTYIKSGYVYPMARNIPAPAGDPMTDAEGAWLVGVAKKARWSMPGSAALLAGFALLAPICGAMPWRPHIWMTGGAGSGKSTLQSKYLGGLLRDFSVYGQGNSTEAGIRQRLSSDALPVLIDELESNTEGDRKRVENILSLIRQASTESQAETLKGTVSGSALQYHIRSMFCLASINVNLPGKADIDRLTKLALRPPAPNTEAQWADLKADLDKISEDDGISSRLLARSLHLLPVVIESARIFRLMATRHFGLQRMGDQYGTLLAGCWCLQHSVAPTEADALAMIKSHDWREHTEDADQDDALAALEAVLSAKIRVGTAGELTVYELVRESSPAHSHKIVDQQVADDALRRHGIRAEHITGELWFGTGVTNLIKLVAGMPFVTDLRGQLLRIPGAKRLATTKKFNGHDSKCIAIPLAPILGDIVVATEDDGLLDELPV